MWRSAISVIRRFGGGLRREKERGGVGVVVEEREREVVDGDDGVWGRGSLEVAIKVERERTGGVGVFSRRGGKERVT